MGQIMQWNKITWEEKNEVVFIGFGKNENKSMTTLSKDTLNELKMAIEFLHEKQSQYKGVAFFSHKPDCFLAGVEIEIIQSLSSEQLAIDGCEAGQNIFNQLEDLKIPSVALIDGVCLGGGLELSLACDFIVATDNAKTKLGLPEVMLGVLPGFGGTYRLPLKIGLTDSLDLILTGKQVDAKKALKLGIVDVVMPKERLMALAPRVLKGEFIKKDQKSNMMNMFTESVFVRKIIFQKAREKVLGQTKGFYPAPLKILDHLEKSFGRSRKDYLQNKALSFAQLSQTPQSKNLQHVFFLTDQSKKFDKTMTVTVPKRAAVLGAGTMGGGIAWLLADQNLNPVMKDINKIGLELGLKQASQNFKSALKRKKISEDEFVRKMSSIIPTTSFENFKAIDLVVEAIVEDINLKKKVFKEVETYVSDECLLTSNTSSLSINKMSADLKHPERFAGLHFFNPVHKMPLVEIITHDKVSEKTINSLYQWVLKAKKTPVVVKDGPGFLVNRILGTYLNEAAFLLEEGLSISDIDQAATDFGMPMGPLRLMDEVGLDVAKKVGVILFEGLGERMRPCSLSSKLVEQGLLGKKNLKGFYEYLPDGQVQGTSNAINGLQIAKKTMDAQYIQMRLVLPMINEAASCLQDGIVSHASNIDLSLIYGIGFPPYRGELLKFADDQGLSRLKPFFSEFAKDVNSDRYKINNYLNNLIDKGLSFYHS